jgi:glutamyl-tRNA synthetase
MSGAITRLAPTPSGYLHEGNALNFLIVAGLARVIDADVALRVDDLDVHRCRPEFADDIFDVLAWLQIPWQHGPKDRADLEAHHSLRLRTEYYRAELNTARASGMDAFACRCTRTEIATSGGHSCVAACRELELALVPGESALRTSTPHGDVVLWRRDDLPAYHLASIIEDRDLGTTHVVRGEDLRESTDIQRFLAPHFGADAFARAMFIHHPLITDGEGHKLSKSNLAAGPMTRDTATRARLQSSISEARFPWLSPDATTIG